MLAGEKATDNDEDSDMTDEIDSMLDLLSTLEIFIILELWLWDFLIAGGNGNIDLDVEIIGDIFWLEVIGLIDEEDFVELNLSESVLVSLKDALVWDLKQGMVVVPLLDYLQSTVFSEILTLLLDYVVLELNVENQI